MTSLASDPAELPLSPQCNIKPQQRSSEGGVQQQIHSYKDLLQALHSLRRSPADAEFLFGRNWFISATFPTDFVLEVSFSFLDIPVLCSVVRIICKRWLLASLSTQAWLSQDYRFTA